MAEENKPKQDFRSAIGQTFERTLTLERASLKIDEEARTVELAFSSEFPVDRWYGKEILDHSAKSADLRRLNSAAPLLLCHDRNQQVGVIESARIDDDKKGRAVVRFSRSAKGEEIFQDVKDGIRRTVSFRYIPRESVLEKRDKEKGDTFRVTKWEPSEISLEPTPADYTVGVGRSQDDQAGQLPPNPNPNPDAERVDDQSKTGVKTAMEKDEKTPAVSPEVAQARAVVEMGEVLGDVEMARQFATEGKTVEEFRAALLEKRKTSQAKTPAEDPANVASRSGNPTAAAVRGPIGGLKSFRGEGARERAYRFGMFMLAGPMSRKLGAESSMLKRAQTFCRENGISLALERAHSESDNETGGFLVPTEFENVMIDLREQFGVFRRFANVVPMSSDSKQRPRRKGGLTAYPIGARGSSRRITESRKAWDLVELNARKWGVLAKYEDELNEDAIISMADDLASEIAYAFTLTEDECGFLGDGSSDYHGIVGAINKLRGLNNTIANIAGLVVASGNIWDEITRPDMTKVIGRLPQYAETPSTRWFCSKTFWAEVMVKLTIEAGGTTAAEIEGARHKMFLGYPVEIAQVLPRTEANSQISCLFGDLSKAAMFGDRRGVTVKLTDSNDTDFEEDLISIKGTERFDINVHDVGNASATASQREPGPLVGLITAAS